MPANDPMSLTPPRASQRDHVWARPTGDVKDPWAWLADRDDPETLSYLDAENAHADQWFAPATRDIDAIYTEIVSRVVEDDSSYPVEHRGWWYASRTEKGRSYAIHERGNSADNAHQHLLLDENAEAQGHDYFAIGAFDISLDNQLLAWSSDVDGGEKYTLRIRDLVTGEDLNDRISETAAAGTAWAHDNQHLFYVTPDDAMRPHKVWRHRLGTAASEDVCIFTEEDERFFVSVELSRSESVIIIDSSSRTSSESWFIAADNPTAAPTVITPRREGIEYAVDHWGDRWIILTNDEAIDFRIMTAPADEPHRWQEFIAHNAGERITAFECFATFGLMQRWVGAQQVMYFVERDGSMSTLAVLDEPHDLESEANPNWHTDSVRITYQSLTVPRTVATVRHPDGALTVLKQTQVPNANLQNYVAERLWAPSDDGTLIPVDIVRHRDTALDGTAPALLYVYGAYEASIPPWFSVARLSLLDRGWVWALAHPRGGGEMGRQWYLDGKLLNKRNTFADTLACARHLGAAGVAHPERIVVRGGSAGGLTVGACITTDPSCFAGAIAEVPFVDIISTMSDPSLPLTVTEWEEWGDPRSEPFASYMASYSPYDNTLAATYPPLYVTAGLHDPRVSYHEPAKWVAKLRAVSPSSTVVFKCEMGAGHGGPSGRYEQWKDEARTLAFALTVVRSRSPQ